MNMDISAWPYALDWVLVAVLGLIFGSLSTLLSHRIPRNEPIGMTRSHCPKCKTMLGVRDLVPLFSWLCSRGKCQHCAAPISGRYPLTELGQAAFFLTAYAVMGASIGLPWLFLLSIALMVMILTDLEYGILPDVMQIVIAVAALGWRWSTGDWSFLPGLLTGAAIGLGLRYGFWLVRRIHGLGLGDVKFLIVAGLWLEPLAFVPVLLLAGVGGIITALLWRKLGKGEEFPFGPALILAFWLLVLIPYDTVLNSIRILIE